MKNLILIPILFALSSPALSLEAVFNKVQDESALCYGREYSAKHLSENPTQKLQKIRAKFIKLKFDDGGVAPLMNLEVTLKGEAHQYKQYKAQFWCSNSGVCSIDCDGGSAEISLNANGDLIVKNQGFSLQGECGEGEDNFVFLEAIKGGDDIFSLSPLPQSYCELTDY